MTKTAAKFKESSTGTTKSRPRGKVVVKTISSENSGSIISNMKKEANQHVNKIFKAIDEANEIRSGKRKPKTFNQFLKEL